MTTHETTTHETMEQAGNTPPAAVAELKMVTLDAPDAAVLGRFWSDVLGWPLTYADENYAMVQGPANILGIGTIPDYRPPAWPDDGHKQFHLDLAAADIEAAATRAVELGATRPERQPGETWVVLLDPAGHPFCISGLAGWQ